MKQEDRELLLQDLCARLPYKIKIMRYVERNNKINELIPELNLSFGLVELFICNDWFIIKPYLRPLSSMTEEEGHEYRMFIDCLYNDFTSESTQCVYVDKINDYLDWLNSRHFDYRGLLERGLAIKAPDGMYNLK